ncbi:metallophosphoesterase family protein [Flavihumibacter sp. UBA7668]|uniref:metallophosphoesterase family protein n=1 Tax=Flavihumibacter sp. UBA7668 TaxID=1946542 RepID=UPI0025C1F24A|nr:metallophosphoesterase [Flavihumibacter sp. UBA7668]
MNFHSICFSILMLTFFFTNAQEPSYFKWDKSKGQLPLTNTRFNTDSSLVQFAILSDRTGGMVPGIFEDAVKKANLLQPQFILSVGDLINGYSTDSLLIHDQWKEFNAILEPLTVPFFYVPGNHDISNSWMQKEWKRRYGQSHYYFIYKDVLFLSLNSQDEGDYGMKEEQVRYFQSILKEFPNVKWTFVFMHQPLWARSNTGFEIIEAALANRNYTVFAGHTHNYLLSERNNRKYYILATSGGGSQRRGEQFGEFDHITWVTFQGTTPKVIHLKLNGLIEEDIVDESLRKKIRPLTSGNWLNTVPVQATTSSVSTLEPVLKLHNPGEIPLTIRGYLPKQKGLFSDPEKIERTLAPGSAVELPFLLKSADNKPIDLASLDPISVELDGEYTIKGKPYSLPSKQRILINWPVTLGNTIQLKHPEYITEDWDWHGTEDADIQFNVNKDNRFVAISATIKDDQFVFQKGVHRDKLLVYFEDKNQRPLLLTVEPDSKKPSYQLTTLDGIAVKYPLSCNSQITDQGVQVQIKLPLKEIQFSKAGIRLNIGYADQDDPTSTEAATIYWKPLWGSALDYAESGIIKLHP